MQPVADVSKVSAAGSFTVILNSSALYWQQTPSLYVSAISKVYDPSAMYAVLDTAPPSTLKIPMDWSATKVPALSRSIYRQFSLKMATRQLVNRRIDPVLSAGNTRVDAGKVAPAHHSNLHAFPIENWTSGATLANILTTTASHTGTYLGGVSNGATVQVVSRFAVRSRPPR
jgi:hypothetical protein